MLKVKTIRTTHGNLDKLVNDFIEKLSKESGTTIQKDDRVHYYELKEFHYQICVFGEKNISLEACMIIYNDTSVHLYTKEED